jgi:hypothetical protein
MTVKMKLKNARLRSQNCEIKACLRTLACWETKFLLRYLSENRSKIKQYGRQEKLFLAALPLSPQLLSLLRIYWKK